LNKEHRDEYNSIKHGFRAAPGGFHLSIGQEESYGVAPPAEKMAYAGGSTFGTSYFLAEPLENAPALRRDLHFRVRRHSINWDPGCLSYGLQLISMSIRNIVSFLKIANGVAADTVRFTRPKESSDADKPWRHTIGVTNYNVDVVVAEEHIKRLNEREILSVYDVCNENEVQGAD
jgi:hypothetical protein